MSSIKKVPVTVLTGFLGSGKTTLLNRILTENHGKRIAVIENEFGEIGIDHALVVNSDEEIFEMNNGCICCTVRGDLIRILGNLMKRRDKFDYILIETTGLADPAPVAQTFFVDDEIQDSLELDGIVTVVDAKHVSMHIDTSQECKEQIAFADVILLNKIDLVTATELEQLESKITNMNAMAKIHATQNSIINMDKILNISGFNLDKALSVKPNFLQPEYPFEWVGIYDLKNNDCYISLEDGPDPTMNVLFLKADADINDLAEKAARLFSEEKQELVSGGVINKLEQVYQLRLDNGGSKSFKVKLSESGRFSLFTQHKPEEFNMSFGNTDGSLVPNKHFVYDAGHTHDSEVTSVGIESKGDLNESKFNDWLGTLLREKGIDIFRMKGIVSLSGKAERFVFQGVHMLFDGRPDRPWGNEKRINQLVFIGRKLNRQELLEGFNSCLVKNQQLSYR